MSAHDPHTTPSHHVHETAPMHDAVDEWHDHSHDAQPQHAHGEVQASGLVLGVGIALTMVIAVSVVIVYGFYTHYNTQRLETRERIDAKTGAGSPSLTVRAEKSKDLSILQAGGSFPMPTEKEGVSKTITVSKIDDAMNAVAQEYTSRKSAAR